MRFPERNREVDSVKKSTLEIYIKHAMEFEPPVSQPIFEETLSVSPGRVLAKEEWGGQKADMTGPYNESTGRGEDGK